MGELDLEGPEKAVLPEFMEETSLSEVLDRSPLSDLDVSRTVLKLLETGLLAPSEASEG